jgi:hypothetical protein
VLIFALEEEAWVDNCFGPRGIACVRWLHEQVSLFNPAVANHFWFICLRLFGDRFADYVAPIVDEPTYVHDEAVWSPWDGMHHFENNIRCPRGHALLTFIVGSEGQCGALTGILQPGGDVLACGLCDYVRMPAEVKLLPEPVHPDPWFM